MSATLVVCKVCKKEHADDVARCPHCGTKYSKPMSKRPVAILVAVTFGLLLFSCISRIQEHDTPAVPPAAIAPPAPPVPTVDLAAKFAKERPDLMQRMKDTLKTKDRYSVLFLAGEYEKVADPEFLAMLARVRADEEKQVAILTKKLDAETRAEARKKGVSIGMTKEQVLMSSWGKPRSVNTSTYKFGVHEQWVYSSGNYLYFENGVLTSIQN